jgi:hypothetical protein
MPTAHANMTHANCTAFQHPAMAALLISKINFALSGALWLLLEVGA